MERITDALETQWASVIDAFIRAESYNAADLSTDGHSLRWRGREIARWRWWRLEILPIAGDRLGERHKSMLVQMILTASKRGQSLRDRTAGHPAEMT